MASVTFLNHIPHAYSSQIVPLSLGTSKKCKEILRKKGSITNIHLLNCYWQYPDLGSVASATTDLQIQLFTELTHFSDGGRKDRRV